MPRLPTRDLSTEPPISSIHEGYRDTGRFKRFGEAELPDKCRALECSRRSSGDRARLLVEVSPIWSAKPRYSRCQSVKRTEPSRHTSSSGKSAVDSSSNVAVTATMHPVIFGSLKVVFAFGARGLTSRTVCPLAPMATSVAGTSRAFVMTMAETGFGLAGAAIVPVAASRRLVAVVMRKIMAIPLCTVRASCL